MNLKPKSVIRISLCRTTQRNPHDRFGINGRYYYNTRNFAINEFHNTKYWKNLNKQNPTEAATLPNYWGFFRSHGTVQPGALT